MLKAVIFDLGEVYVNGFKDVELLLEPVLGISSDKIHSIIHSNDLMLLFRGKISEDEYLSKTIQRGGWKIDLRDFKRIIRNNFKEVEGTEKIIKELNAKGLKIGLLSDHSKEWIDYIKENFNHHKMFHHTLYSFEVGLIKVEGKGFEIMVKKLEVLPEECLFIDDNPNNLIPARKLGMKVIQFNNSNQLKKELVSLGVI